MSGLYEALKQAESENPISARVRSSENVTEFFGSVIAAPVDLNALASVSIKALPLARLVALSEPQGLGAEKFRALVTRLENLRKRQEFRSLQITSSVVGEGKSVVAANLALTFAKFSSAYRVLLIEGDLHRPTLGSMFGLEKLKGLGEWWSDDNADINAYIYRVRDMNLCLLPSGRLHEQPSESLQSKRFAQMFAHLCGSFDWVIVDSTPMLPVIDVNVWCRLIDGTLLVVREGVAPLKELAKGLEGLDNLKLIGIVMNEASELTQRRYKYSYYGYKKPAS